MQTNLWKNLKTHKKKNQIKKNQAPQETVLSEKEKRNYMIQS